MRNPHSLYEAMKNQWGKHGGLNGYEIGPACWEWIQDNLIGAERTLEFGSGLSTWLFGLHQVEHTAIECSPMWFIKVMNSPFLQSHVNLRLVELESHACAEDPWYDYSWDFRYQQIDDKIHASNPDLIFIDGPEGKPNGPGRMGFAKHFMNKNMGAEDVIIVVDDTNRSDEMKLLQRISDFWDEPFIIHDDINGKQFGTIGGETYSDELFASTVFSKMGRIDVKTNE